jgi:hypothetical protein
MPYEYDIFVSYKHTKTKDVKVPGTIDWIRMHFKPMLMQVVGLELGHPAKVFVDEDEIALGASWPTDIGHALGKSRILVALWSNWYSNSVWCMKELTYMLAREQAYGCRTLENPHGLVIPAIISGEGIPAVLGKIKCLEIQPYYNTRMQTYSPRAEELESLLASKAKDVVKAIQHAPQWQAAWPVEAAQEFNSLYDQGQEPVQDTLPVLTS